MAKEPSPKSATSAARKAAPKPTRATPAKLATPTDIRANKISDVQVALNGLLADSFALYLKTKNFHWHVSGPHFREYHLLFDEQATEILAATDLIAESIRKIGCTTLRSIGHIGRLQRVKDNNDDFVSAADMLRELTDDNRAYVEALREASAICDEAGDTPTVGLIDDWIDQAEQRVWFLFETSRNG